MVLWVPCNVHEATAYKSLMLYGSAGLKFVLVANGAVLLGMCAFAVGVFWGVARFPQ